MKATIIGAGNVGVTLAKKLQQVGDYELVYKSDKSKENATKSGLDSKKIVELQSAKLDGEFIIICVKDGDIANVVDELLETHSNALAGKIVLHTSGTLGKSVLIKLETANCLTAAAHPFQTFFYNEVAVLDGISWGVESDAEAFTKIEKLINLIGGKAIKLSKETLKKKALYHISAVAASNFMALSIDLAKELADEAGIDAKDFLPQILETTLQNNLKQLGSSTPAITGPVVRGEVGTIAAHIATLGETINGVIYKNMCESLALMALDKGLLSGEKFEQIMEILD